MKKTNAKPRTKKTVRSEPHTNTKTRPVQSSGPKSTMSAPKGTAVPTVKVKPAMAQELQLIWSEYIALEEWTPADRWLSNRMNRSVFSRLERLWISGMFLAGLRYGWLALFGEQKTCGTAAEGSVKSQLAQIVPENFFFWIEQRLLADKQIQTPYRFRHADSRAAYSVMKSISEQFQKGNNSLEISFYDGLPRWIAPYIQRRAEKSGWSDAEMRRFVRRHSSVQPLWIRLTRDSYRAEVTEELRSKGFAILHTELSSLALRGDKNIVTTEAFKTGKIDIQDFASQRIGNAVIARTTGAGHIWDCCAGNGGKTMQIASGVKEAKIRVSDINDRKLVRIHERAVQQKCTDRIAYVPWDGTKLPDFHSSITDQGGFDIVLVDAPCSGSGTWRKNPDGRLFFDESRLGELTAIQQKLIRIAGEAVRPGGWLIYGTCSFLVEENEAQVESFLNNSRHFTLDQAALCGNPMVDSDTTFFAAMKRNR